MQIKSKRIQRTDRFRDHMNRILDNQEMDCDYEWWLEPKAQAVLEDFSNLEEDRICDSRELGLDGPDVMVFAAYRAQEQEREFLALTEERVLSLAEPEVDHLHLIFFVKDMKNRICLERAFDPGMKARIHAKLKAERAGKSLPFDCTYVLDQEYEEQAATIGNLRRFEMVQVPPLEGRMNLEDRKNSEPGQPDPLCGMAFTVKLFQLVEIYNLVGDRIFQHNVRLGINEMLGVDQAICETLEKEPERFWFKNNGITILVQNPDFSLKRAEALCLDQVEAGRKLSFSVINGAQTITAATRYFYEAEYRVRREGIDPKEKEKLEKELKEAKEAEVLLRIIRISETDESKALKMAKEISVALNRQKPIKMEDIAFTTPFVEKLTRYLERKGPFQQAGFQLIRRGDNLEGGRQMELHSFARARKACIGEPGEARNHGAKILLKSAPGEDGYYHFRQEGIFVREWEQASEEEEEGAFRRHYGAVWFAHQAARGYEAQRKTISGESQELQAVIGNGKWYFTALLVQLLNGFRMLPQKGGREIPDFSQFDARYDNISDKLPEAIRYFAQLTSLFIQNEMEDEEIDSNLFKKSRVYKKLLAKIREMARWKREVSAPVSDPVKEYKELLYLLFEKWAQLMGVELPLKLPEEQTGSVKKEDGGNVRTGAGSAYIILNEKKIPVKTMAEGMRQTVEYILNQEPALEEMLQKEELPWISANSEQAVRRDGYFRAGPKEISAGGKTYWIGTSSNTGMKMSQVRRLCRLANLPQKQISWCEEGNIEPELVW